MKAKHLWDYLQQRSNDDWLIGYDVNQFNRLVEKLFQQLIQFSQQRTPPKIILSERDPFLFLASFLAAVIAQCPLFLCNPDWGEQEWQQVFKLVQPDLIWEDTGTHRHGDTGKDTGTRGPKDAGKDTGTRGPKDAGKVQIDPLRVAASPTLGVPKTPHTPSFNGIMIPTGGSSGKIRFAIHTWETLTASVKGFYSYFKKKPVNSFCVLPLYHVSGLMQFLRSFLTGGKLLILPYKNLKSGERGKVEPKDFFISLVPTQLQFLLQSDPIWLSGFYTVLLGGAPAWQSLLDTVREYDIRLAPTYGMTETASQVVTLKPIDFLNGNNSSGQVLPHARVTIRNFEGELLDTNQTGIIHIQADSLCLGYYPEMFSDRDDFQTDDLGFFDANGYLNIVGRNSQKIITGGENVFPIEVEAAILATDLVVDVCAIALPDPKWGQAITAVYVPKQESISVTVIKTAIDNKLSKFKQPKYWVKLQKIPRNSQGKVNYLLVQRIASENIIKI